MIDQVHHHLRLVSEHGPFQVYHCSDCVSLSWRVTKRTKNGDIEILKYFSKMDEATAFAEQSRLYYSPAPTRQPWAARAAALQ